MRVVGQKIDLKRGGIQSMTGGESLVGRDTRGVGSRKQNKHRTEERKRERVRDTIDKEDDEKRKKEDEGRERERGWRDGRGPKERERGRRREQRVRTVRAIVEGGSKQLETTGC